MHAQRRDSGPAASDSETFEWGKSSGDMDISGEKFPVPPEVVYEYLRATIDVGKQRLSLFLDNKKIDEQPYRMR